MFSEYPKINSLWKREGWSFQGVGPKNDAPVKKGGNPFIVGDYACQEFGNIRIWDVFEKVDGTNIRIFYDGEHVVFAGRTKDAQLPPHLLAHLREAFTPEKMSLAFPVSSEGGPQRVILFGEGYGPKIQSCGGNYRKEVGFILFDVKVGSWWLQQDPVEQIAQSLGIHRVPHIGRMGEQEIIDFVKSKPLSKCSDVAPQMMEGVVCRSLPLMLFRNGDPVMWKLKCKEFV